MHREMFSAIVYSQKVMNRLTILCGLRQKLAQTRFLSLQDVINICPLHCKANMKQIYLESCLDQARTNRMLEIVCLF